MNQNTKFCARCKQHKFVCDFSLRGKGRSGYQAWCKICLSEYSTKAARLKVRRARGLSDDHPTMQGCKSGKPLGSLRADKAGYIQIKTTGHHRADEHGWVYQHILVAEEKYGFPITLVFTVHHKNGRRWDNRPENLELRVGNHGYGADLIPALMCVAECREEARRILAEYDALEEIDGCRQRSVS